MNAELNKEIEGIQPLSPAELDAVSGGAYKQAYSFSVAGMKIAGGYDDKTGAYDVSVDYGDNYVWQGKY